MNGHRTNLFRPGLLILVAAAALLILPAARVTLAPNSSATSATPTATPATSVATSQPPQVSRPRADLIGIAGNAFPWEDHWDGFASLLDGTNAGWARVELRWERIEPSSGAWQWGATDALVSAYASHGYHELGLLDYAVAWAAGGSGSAAVLSPPTDLDAWTAYVRATVARYHDRIHAWEIWNEPDAPIFWGGKDGGDPATYLRLLQRAYQAIKTIDPQATVMNGGVTGTGRGAKFLNALLDLGGGRYLDAVALHPYLPTGDLEQNFYPSVVWPLLARARARAGKPLWITEFGWSSGAPDEGANAGSEAAQAVDITCQLPMLFELGDVAHVFVFQFKDPGNRPNSFGLVHADGTRKPAYTALTTLAGRLVGLTFTGQIDLGVAGVHDDRFASSNRRVDIIWSPSGAHDVGLPFAQPSARIWRIDGSVTTQTAANGSLPLQVGADPLIIEQSG